MPRRPSTIASRTAGGPTLLVPTTSNCTSPPDSAYPSTYTSDAEGQRYHSSTSGHSAFQALEQASSAKTAKRQYKPFPFLHLPSELRIKIYGYYFDSAGSVIDLDPGNYKRIHKKLGILRTCHLVYQEASHLFYSTHTFRVFPTYPGRYFKTKKPLLARLCPSQRASLTSLELRLGPGWNKPPRGWVVNMALGLRDCVNVRKLTVFVECDPSDSFFNGFRKANGFYEQFSRDLLREILVEMPHLQYVYFDAWSTVMKSGAMMTGLCEVAMTQRRQIAWGPERGWTDGEEDEQVSVPINMASPSVAVVA